MENINVEVVKKLKNGKQIIKVIKEIKISKKNEVISKKIEKYTLKDKNGILNILDLNGNISGIQYFDNYQIDEFGNIIIAIRKDGKEFYERILSKFDLSETNDRIVEEYFGKPNIDIFGPERKVISPTKTIDDIIPKSYYFNYGVINQDGLLSIYPSYDYMEFGNENSCIVGLFEGYGMIYGYNDIITGEAITPVCFSKTSEFYNKRASVKYNDRYGYVDRDKIMENPENKDDYATNLSPRYFRATDFVDGQAIVCYSKPNPFEGAGNMKIDVNGQTIDYNCSNTYVKKHKKIR